MNALILYGSHHHGSTEKLVRAIAAHRSCTYLGKFGCRGYNTYGPWKLIGGMNKEHPSSAELAEAVRFFEEAMTRCWAA